MNEQTKTMTKLELACEIMRIIQEARKAVVENDAFSVCLKALDEIETLCHFEASEEIQPSQPSGDDHIRKIAREEIEKYAKNELTRILLQNGRDPEAWQRYREETQP